MRHWLRREGESVRVMLCWIEIYSFSECFLNHVERFRKIDGGKIAAVGDGGVSSTSVLSYLRLTYCLSFVPVSSKRTVGYIRQCKQRGLLSYQYLNRSQQCQSWNLWKILLLFPDSNICPRQFSVFCTILSPSFPDWWP